MLVDELRTSGFSNPSRELMQLLAGLILLWEASAREVQQPGRSLFASDGLSETLEEIHRFASAWPTIPQMLGLQNPRMLVIPEVVAAHERSSGRAAAFLWEGIRKLSICDPHARTELLSTLEIAIDLWIHEARYAAEFATPPALAEFMVALANPQPGERIYDPCFGAGGLLARTASSLSKTDKARSGESFSSTSIWGQELDGNLYPVALARIILSGFLYPNLKIGDSLAESIPAAGAFSEFDCIIANVPFGFRPSKVSVRATASGQLRHSVVKMRHD
jgi:hypothetical protein